MAFHLSHGWKTVTAVIKVMENIFCLAILTKVLELYPIYIIYTNTYKSPRHTNILVYIGHGHVTDSRVETLT